MDRLSYCQSLTVFSAITVYFSSPTCWQACSMHMRPSLSQVPDLFALKAAAYKALAAQQRGKLVTRTLHAELVYNISGSRHVSTELLTCWLKGSRIRLRLAPPLGAKLSLSFFTMKANF
jgi:Kinase binding protein CGI-121